MLVITRQTDDSIMIGDDVEITILQVKGTSVRIGINAPRELSVHRSEVFTRLNCPVREIDDSHVITQ